jgi:cytochrome c
MICGTIAFVSSLALARVHPFGEAGLYATRAAETPIMGHSSVPPEVRTILAAKCGDCHSSLTHAPFYGRFAPVSWLMERDIVEARKAMNLSLWDTYPADQQQTIEAKILHETRSDEMPPVQYRMIHWDARIVDADLRIFDQWAHGPQAIQAGAAVAGEGDSARGKELFERRCTGCHSMTRNREGPQLQGVYGRVSGSVANYAYSQTLKKSQIVWDEKSLEQWLTDPDAFLPGNNMDFLVSRPQERRDLISYLKQSSGK